MYKQTVETNRALFVITYNLNHNEFIIGVDTFDGLGVVVRDLKASEAKALKDALNLN